MEEAKNPIYNRVGINLIIEMMAKQTDNFIGNFKLRVDFERPPDKEIRLLGFLFNCRGKLLQKQYVKDNILEFNLEKGPTTRNRGNINFEQLRLFIVPETDKKVQRITNMEELEKYKGYEPILTMDANQNLTMLPIPWVLSQFWFLCQCRVTGKVSKWFQVGNSWVDRAVCKARVHICEIDPIWYWIRRIPDHVIAKIPDAIFKPEFRIPIPIPDPGPFERQQFSMMAEQGGGNIFQTQSLVEKQKQAFAKLPELGMELKQQLNSGNLNVIREAIANNYTLLHPWFCLWPWWWSYFYRCNELAVVETNSSGKFEKSVFFNCFGDKPDIYIWVEYLINGVWTTVHKPPKPCNTYWNYACGTPINIHITDPLVPGDCCCDCEISDGNVWIRTVGHTSVSHINQDDTIMLPPPGQTVAYNRIGLTDAPANGDNLVKVTNYVYSRPFGGSPILRMGFGPDLPNDNLYYYRWSFRQRKNADLIDVGDSYKPLVPKGGEVRKGYDYMYKDSSDEWQWAPNNVRLGPNPIGPNDNLYIIPPMYPTMDPFNVPASSFPQWHQMTYYMDTIVFDSTAFPEDGLYELKLELFDKAGNLLQNLARQTFKTPRQADAAYSENAPDSLLENPTADYADAFKMLIRIDNGKCLGDIFTVNVNSHPASSDCCGFVKYKPLGVEADLELSFQATHPNDFAVFQFNLYKGSCGGVSAANANGMVIASADGYNLSGGIYSQHFNPGTLLGECYNNGIGKAAFAESLYVENMATDGISRVNRDFSKTIAFALEP